MRSALSVCLLLERRDVGFAVDVLTGKIAAEADRADGCDLFSRESMLQHIHGAV